jgi:hypothetical protein
MFHCQLITVANPHCRFRPAIVCTVNHTRETNIPVNISFITVISQPSFLTESHNSARRDPFLTRGLRSSSRWPQSHATAPHPPPTPPKNIRCLLFHLNWIVASCLIHIHRTGLRLYPNGFATDRFQCAFQYNGPLTVYGRPEDRQSQPTRFGFSGYHANFHQGVSRKS